MCIFELDTIRIPLKVCWTSNAVSLTHDVLIVSVQERMLSAFSLLRDDIRREVPHVWSNKFSHNIFLGFLLILVIVCIVIRPSLVSGEENSGLEVYGSCLIYHLWNRDFIVILFPIWRIHFLNVFFFFFQLQNITLDYSKWLCSEHFEISCWMTFLGLSTGWLPVVGTEKCKISNWKPVTEIGKGKGAQTVSNTGHIEGGKG